MLAGASIALLYNWTFVRKHPEKLTFRVKKQPQQGYALAWKWRHDLEENYFHEKPEPVLRHFRFTAEFTATWTSSAAFRSPPETGDTIQLDEEFGNVDEPVASTYVQFW